MKSDKEFLREVEGRSGQELDPCYQCLKCLAGCPVSRYMDYAPNSIIRMIQYGQKEKVLKSHAIWLCVSCMTCGVRCPNEVDMSAVMDTLREMSIEAGYRYNAERDVVMLHEEFIRSVGFWGRLHEITFFVPYMVRSLDFLTNLQSGALLFFKGKLPLMPKGIPGLKEFKKTFKAAYKTKGQLRRTGPGEKGKKKG